MVDRRRLPFDRLARDGRKLQQHVQRFPHRAFAYDRAPERAEAAFALKDTSVARSRREVNEPDRFAARCAAGACDARDCDNKIDACAFQRADGHGCCRFAADSAKIRKRVGFDTEHDAFRLIGISDEAAVKHG
jgi:hypothetical protein